MSIPPDAEVLAREIDSQAEKHPRVSILLIPQADVEDDEVVIAFYWLDLEDSVACDTVVRFADYAGQPADQAAKQILDKLTENTSTPPAS